MPVPGNHLDVFVVIMADPAGHTHHQNQAEKEGPDQDVTGIEPIDFAAAYEVVTERIRRSTT